MKYGRVRCRRCERVLEEPNARRRPMPHERKEFDKMMADWRGEWWLVFDWVQKYNGRKPLADTAEVTHHDELNRTLTYRCKCGTTYRVDHRELGERVQLARSQGVDIFLSD